MTVGSVNHSPVSRIRPVAKPVPERVDWLGRSLKRLYSGMLQEPIPEEMLALLDRLERREEQRDSDGGADPPPASKPE